MKKILESLAQMQVKMPIQTIILVLLVAFILAMVVYVTYKYTYSGVLYNPRFNLSLVMMTMITTIVMIVIGSNISVSLGMVGALSIVRFRTAVKDPRDTSFIFWCIVIGLACGTQNYYVAIIGSIFVCLILFIFKRAMQKDNKYVLIIRGYDIEINDVEIVIKRKLKDFVCKSKFVNKDNMELIYDIKFKKDVDNSIIKELTKLDGIDIVNIIQSNTETMG